MSLRLLPVPDGCNGDRVDAALARMTGLSRSRVGELCEAGDVRRNGEVLAKSARLRAGDLLEVDMPAPRPAEPVPTPVDGMELLYEDEDIVGRRQAGRCRRPPLHGLGRPRRPGRPQGDAGPGGDLRGG